ncbi:NaeI family type II restriction endonuclease [Aurantiacibacter rhizosphaerae]|uniref:Type II restriction enzyme NaeI domain-containing protein n=1 Tax=Aurantiacibacter rhizosphaerae TaxID=2691582 RepID=A0A844XCH7_9SPHN|nr:NaeI family type II restriction endonuclease [Aurantiacibacter rhizosphaerae]MWV27473.1 hypothetical protein [Aurantiacibacter rhizosphaerae]
MKSNIPESKIVEGHPRFSLLSAMKDDLINRAGALRSICSEIPPLLREAIDVVIDTPRTGRRDYEDLEKTEKTYIGTRVEILVRSYFRLPKGKLDLLLLGQDADVKFTTKNNWMIPREAVGKPCLLLAADEAEAKCYFGLFCADEEYLTAGANQDKKRQVSAEGFGHILWVFCKHPLQPNFWRTIAEASAEAVAVQRTGNDRVVTLFREVQGIPIAREVVEATARQKDFMRRIRADNGRGTRDRLAKEGILLLSGTYDATAIAALGLPPTGKSEFVSHAPDAAQFKVVPRRSIPDSFVLK